ncbi:MULTISPECIES: DUF4844 domain-containing protein [unclassified Cellulophaga]|uniref:DUF4844 domain-containing protein n=1 Tax=unclassified Cellulophaga TaxID=2634405 RepID=UPI0026E1DA9B|nr:MULTISPECIES: DUF4844 domain-containing protein [unclassified Cellulophaga]MDO6489857.1 DUF4844 domain-containing protein [Cellulophaga sp. 2_MG-2023]MDO6494949.1 DUF4844 domain-containing protein [Cellulophaga sp. 3_MG-2023]
MMKYIKILVLLLTLSVYGQNATEIKTPKNANEKFIEFIAKKKFYAENHSPNISDEKLRPILTEKINEVATDFKQISGSKKPTDKKYQEAIRIGLLKFPEMELEYDSEDRERILLYFQEIMDIVGLQSSNGKLNNFYYGFDPNELKK